jgi:hypothetical protein
MGEFGTLISKYLFSFFNESPSAFIVVITGLLFYFGYLYNEPNVKDYQRNRIQHYISGMVYIFKYLIMPLLILSYLRDFYDFNWQNKIILTKLKIFILFYASLVIHFSVLKSKRAVDKLTYFEAEYVLNYLGIKYSADSNLFDYVKGTLDKFWKLGTIERIWILVYIGLFEWTVSYLLIFSAFVVFYSTTSIEFGVLLYSYIFFAVSAYAGAKGTNGSIYRYAEIFYDESRKKINKSEIGRLKAADSSFVHLLKEKDEPGQCFLLSIPRKLIDRIELLSLSEFQQKSSSV